MATANNQNLDDSKDNNAAWSLLPNVKSVATQSLKVDDTLPHFNFNEPGPLALATSILQKSNIYNSDSEESFVVLGKNSLESFKDGSTQEDLPSKTLFISHLHSFNENQNASQIKQSDKDSYLDSESSVSQNEAEIKLSKVFEENLQLKETLKVNNESLKSEFEKLTLWQKNVLEVCNNQQQKYNQTMFVINKLREENDNLKMKLKSQPHDYSSNYQCNSILEKDLRKSNLSMEDSCSCQNKCSSHEKFDSSFVAQTNSNEEFLKKIEELTEALQKSQMYQIKTQQEIKEMKLTESIYAKGVDQYTQKIDEVNKKLECLQYNFNISDQHSSINHSKLCKNCLKTDSEIKDLNETIIILQEEVKKWEEESFSIFDSQAAFVNNNTDCRHERQLLEENIESHNQKIIELNKCFSSYFSRNLFIQNVLKQCIHIIENMGNKIIPCNEEMSESNIVQQVNLKDLREKLIDEKLNCIDVKKSMLNIQKTFQKLFADYNNAICELEIIKEDNSKIKTIKDKIIRESSDKMEEVNKKCQEEKIKLDNEMANLLAERVKLHQEKREYNELKEALNKDLTSFSKEKEKLSEERAVILKERVSLDQQSKLFDKEETMLQKEKKNMQKKYDKMDLIIRNLQDELEVTKRENNQFRLESAALNEKVKVIRVYEIQTEEREKEFDETYQRLVKLKEEYDTLHMQHIELRERNYQLQQENDKFKGVNPE